MQIVFWTGLIYSFIGFLIETLYALVTTGRLVNRKTMFLLPLCPVYGLGALAILSLVSAFPRVGISTIIAAGILMGTAVEYAYGACAERVFRVRIWDYASVEGTFRGRVHVLFSIFWGLLAICLVLWIHPALTPFLQAIPDAFFMPMVVVVAVDVAITFVMLYRFGRHDGRLIGCPVISRVS